MTHPDIQALIDLEKELGCFQHFDGYDIVTLSWPQAKTILSAISALKANPVEAGYVMVPVEPTEAMLEAWEKSKPYDGDYTNEKCATACWKDMVAAALAASPSPAKVVVEAFTPSGADCHPDSPHASRFVVHPAKDEDGSGEVERVALALFYSDKPFAKANNLIPTHEELEPWRFSATAAIAAMEKRP